MTPPDVLLVDDERLALNAYSLSLRSGGIGPVVACQSPLDALDLVRNRDFSLAFLDLSMPGMSGEALLEQIRLLRPDLPVVILTAFNDAETAMRCIHAGAKDFLVKPVDKNRLLTTARRILEDRALRLENLRLKTQLLAHDDPSHPAFADILTRCDAMHAVFRYARAIADSPDPVFITGETGTGKDLMARAIHRLSERQGDFVAVNVAGLDEQMFNDVLFGHAKGAYTGALQDRDGLLLKARGGTLFLDEIGDVSLPLQSKLLRVLESGEFYASGCDDLRRSDARIVVATNRDPRELCDGGRMRRDLFYRLDVHRIALPPLRERPADVPLLANAFAALSAQSLNRPPPSFDPDAMAWLSSHDWPGNVRELKAVVADAARRASNGVVSLELLGVGRRSPPSPAPCPEPLNSSPEAPLPTIRQAIDDLVRLALLQAGGNQRRAASILGISQPALSKRLKGMKKVI